MKILCMVLCCLALAGQAWGRGSNCYWEFAIIQLKEPGYYSYVDSKNISIGVHSGCPNPYWNNNDCDLAQLLSIAMKKHFEGWELYRLDVEPIFDIWPSTQDGCCSKHRTGEAWLKRKVCP